MVGSGNGCSLASPGNNTDSNGDRSSTLTVTGSKISNGIKRNSSYTDSFPTEGKEARVLVIYTGGTIGMMRNEDNVLQPKANALAKKMRTYPDMHDEAYAQKRFGSAGPLILPRVNDEPRRIVYCITEYDPLLDSSNMTINEWIRIAEDIKVSYQFYDGFVILHGTDTLSYTASALSFMLENLGKTVIITGSQIPIFETRTDGKDNFTSALILAGNYVIPEVCVVFGTKLLRGNRTIKTSSEQLEAFDTPNAAPLAKFGVKVEVDYRAIFRPCTVEKFHVHSRLDENVGLLRIFPSVSLATFKAFLKPPMKGVVLQTFGTGNVPSNREDLMKELKTAVDGGCIIINCTQCVTGSVSAIYETGSILAGLGVLPGFDMTPEAALSKLAYVLGKDEWSLDVKKQMMQTNLRGELTSNKAENMEAFDLIDAVARSLHLSTPKELEQLGATLFPAIVNSAVVSGDMKKLDNLKSYGADLAGVNYDRRTALHIACCEGNFEIVQYLLLHGVSVHLRDRHDRTPLLEAISTDHHDIISLLIKCGAHLTGSSRAIGEHLCSAAARGYIKRLESYCLAGADLSQADPSGRTALHTACLHGHRDVVEYLLNKRVDRDVKDLLNLMPIDYAKKVGNSEIVNILENNMSKK